MDMRQLGFGRHVGVKEKMLVTLNVGNTLPASFDHIMKPGSIDKEMDPSVLNKTSLIFVVSLPLLNLFGAHLVFIDKTNTKTLLF